jgi:predicted outer membrane protein
MTTLPARALQHRATARTLLGPAYAARMRELGAILQATATQRGAGVLEVATSLCRERHLVGLEATLVMATAVELLDPTVTEAAP